MVYGRCVDVHGCVESLANFFALFFFSFFLFSVPLADVPAGERAVFKASGRPSRSGKGGNESGKSSGKADALATGVGLGLVAAAVLM